MYLCKEDQDKLTVKNARRAVIAWRTLADYCKDSKPDTIDGSPRIKKDLEPGVYAKNVRIVSSGNEPRIYGFVEDNNGEILASADILRTDPAAYADIARYCGAFMEAFNLYCYYNEI